MYSANELSQKIMECSDSGLGLACMYARKVPDGHVLEAVMAGERVERITAFVEGAKYLSVTPDIPCASIYEREIYETHGIYPMGHSDMRPLRSGPSEGGTIPHNNVFGDGIFEIPVGPIHAGVIGPGHFRFSVAGEPILMMKAYLGYSRRGVERLMEASASADNTMIAERISGDNAVAHALAYLQTVEQDTDIPERARLIRTVMSELERIHNHLGTIGGIASDASLAVPAAHAGMLRENMLRLNERVFGHRQLWGMLRIGGLSKDIPKIALDNVEREVVKAGSDAEEVVNIMIRSPSFMDRAQTTGRLSAEDAVRLRAVGPVARSSGVNYDVRKTRPYAAYGMVALDVPTSPGGDVYARLTVRKKEIKESVSVILQCINMMKGGPVRTEARTEDGFYTGITESPRGETVHCAHIDNGRITRYKIRDASFPNWPALECAALGNIMPDFPLVNKSFDLSYSGNDL